MSNDYKKILEHAEQTAEVNYPNSPMAIGLRIAQNHLISKIGYIMNEEEMRALRNLSEEELEKKYRDILVGMGGEPMKTSDPTVKTVHDHAEHADKNEREKFLLTIIIQHKMINQLKEQMAQNLMARPNQILYKAQSDEK